MQYIILEFNYAPNHGWMTCVDQRDQYTWADDRSHTLHAHGAVDSDIYFDRVTFFVIILLFTAI